LEISTFSKDDRPKAFAEAFEDSEEEGKSINSDEDSDDSDVNEIEKAYRTSFKWLVERGEWKTTDESKALWEFKEFLDPFVKDEVNLKALDFDEDEFDSWEARK